MKFEQATVELENVQNWNSVKIFMWKTQKKQVKNGCASDDSDCDMYLAYRSFLNSWLVYTEGALVAEPY